jgi:hypothetical protein
VNEFVAVSRRSERRLPAGPRLWPRFVIPCLLLCLLQACTTLPTQEFTSYKETFAKARQAGEEVLVEHAATRAQFSELDAKIKAQRGTQPPPRFVPFKPAEIIIAGSNVDHVAKRFQAWEVVARYNEALTALAEGKTSQQVAAAFGGLAESLADFPLDAIQDLAGSIAPFLAPLKVIVAAAEQERSKQEFLGLVQRGSPLIREKFIKFLIDDTEELRNARFGLNTLQYNPLLRQAGDTARRCETLANAHAASTESTALIGEINASLRTLPLNLAGQSPVPAVVSTPGALAYTPLVHAALLECRDSVRSAVAATVAKDGELTAYDAMLKAYLVLLSNVSASVARLEHAAASNRPTAPPTRELLGAFITLRQTVLTLRTKD